MTSRWTLLLLLGLTRCTAADKPAGDPPSIADGGGLGGGTGGTGGGAGGGGGPAVTDGGEVVGDGLQYDGSIKYRRAP
jgi:hypothetical protein